MTLTQDVAENVISLGRATVDDIAPLFPKHTRKQVMDAIHNAKYLGRIVIVERGKSRGKGKGTYPYVYGPPKTAGVPCRPSISSVFDLGRLAGMTSP